MTDCVVPRSASNAAKPAARLQRLDALRGLAVVWMTVFHFCFDLNFFGIWQNQFLTDPWWVWQRAAIVTLFICCMAMGQTLACLAGQPADAFWRRWLQVAGCAALVSAGSYAVFPHSFIYFGVLHAVAVLSLVARFSPLMSMHAARGKALWWAGLAVILLYIAMQYIAENLHTTAANSYLIDVLNSGPGSILGLVTTKPVTEDYVPLVPWLAVMCWAMAATWWLQRTCPAWLGAPLGRWARPLVWLGRHSLAWYMLHQPVLLGIIWLALSVLYWV